MPNVIRTAAGVTARLLRRLLWSVEPGGRSWLARQMAKSRFDPSNQAMAHFCTQYILAWKNKQYAVSENGEADLLKRIAAFTPKILLDVGANVGEWTVAACDALPGAHVHCFEVAPKTAAILSQNIVPYRDRVTINTVGLGDREQSVTLYLSAQDSTIASTVRDAFTYSASDEGLTEIEEIVAELTTGDAYVARTGIDRIGMLKIDVEGAEFSVLRGFAATLERGAVDLVQFEYGPLNLTTRIFLKDYYAFFEARGYILGKLYPEGVAFKDYAVDDEDFVGPNYVACRREYGELVEALRCPPLARA